MRKFLLFSGSLLISALLLVLFNPWAAPTLAKAEPRLAVNADGSSVYLLENREELSLIYEVDREGTAAVVYSEPALMEKMRSVISDLIYWEGSLWFLRESGDAGAAWFRAWELIRYDPAEDDLKTVYARVNTDYGSTPRLSADEGLLYITLCATDGLSAEVYELDPYAERPGLTQILRAAAPEDVRFQLALYGRRRLYCALSDGRLVAFSSGSGGFGTELSGGMARSLGWAGGNVFFADARGLNAYYGVEGVFFRLAPPAWVNELLAGAPAFENGFAALVSASDGKTALLWYDGADFGPAVRLSVKPGGSLPMSAAFLQSPKGWASLAALAAILLAGACLCAKRLLWRLTAMLYALVVVLALLLTGSVYLSASGTARLERQDETRVAASEYTQALGDPANRSAIQERAALLDDKLVGVSHHVQVSGELLFADGADVFAAVSARLPYGYPAAYYDAEIMQGITRAMSLKDEVMVSRLADGREVCVSIRPLPAGQPPEAILLTRMSVNDITASERALLETLLARSGLAVLLSFALLFLVVVIFVKPVRLLPGQMNEIAAGRLTFGEVSIQPGEVGDIQRAMQELCVALSIREYEAAARLEAYRRFVPQALENVLGKTEVMKSASGASTASRGEMGIVTIKNHSEAESRLDSELYVSFVQTAVKQLHTTAKSHGALFLSGDFSPADFRLLFPYAAADGIRFGLELLGETGTAGVRHPSFSMVLHSSGFVYGVAGLEDRAVSFFSAYEMGLLAGFTARFSELGIKILVTEQYLHKLGGQFSTRYIGFVSSPDESSVIKLYEVLDVFPAGEKLQREQYDYQFQEAIRLYYKNDFYLARNIFSSLYKSCPSDCVARWYIFACERFFNSSDLSQINYGLFGAEGAEAAEV